MARSPQIQLTRDKRSVQKHCSEGVKGGGSSARRRRRRASGALRGSLRSCERFGTRKQRLLALVRASRPLHPCFLLLCKEKPPSLSQERRNYLRRLIKITEAIGGVEFKSGKP